MQFCQLPGWSWFAHITVCDGAITFKTIGAVSARTVRKFNLKRSLR
jgi:hypothetical protein